MKYVPPRSGASSSDSDPGCAPVVIGSRDTELFADLFLVQVLARDQVRALFGCSVARCNVRLAQLVGAGFLARHQFHSHSFGDQAVYSLGRKARPSVTRFLEQQGLSLEPVEIRHQLMRPPLSLMDHTLAIAQVYIAAKAACRGGAGIALSLWLSERIVRAEYEVRRATRQAAERGSVQKEVWAPDAYFEVEHAGTVQAFALEADLSNTSAREWAAKIRTSERFRTSGLADKILGRADFRTLVVTDGGLRRIRSVLAIAEHEQSRSFLCATFEDLEREGLFAPIWRGVGLSSPVRLLQEGT